MTEKLYDGDAALMTFDATVRACTPKGDRYEILLDKTAFFPCEGGQGADHGRIGEATVLDARLVGDEILHITDRPLAVGEGVFCTLDVDRRLRHMQIHTAEHILSGVLHSMYGATNVGFHLGDTEVTLDLDLPLTEEEVATAEEAANSAIRANLPVRVLWPRPEELSSLDYRAKLALTEGVRLVEIAGVDLCACCAPHVARTGECGLLKVTGYMHYKGGVRLHIVAGADALTDYREKQTEVHAVSVALSVKESEISAGVARLLQTMAEERRVLSEVRALLRRERLAAASGKRDIVVSYQGLDAAALRAYAEDGAALCEGIALILLPDGDGCRYAMASRTEDVKVLSASLHASLGGRGGGKPSLTQGSFPVPADAVIACLGRA